MAQVQKHTRRLLPLILFLTRAKNEDERPHAAGAPSPTLTPTPDARAPEQSMRQSPNVAVFFFLPSSGDAMDTGDGAPSEPKPMEE